MTNLPDYGHWEPIEEVLSYGKTNFFDSEHIMRSLCDDH